MTDIVDRLLAGDTRTIARVITMIERGDPAAVDLVTALRRAGAKRSLIVGLTGPPGAGKSTLIDSLTRTARQRGRTVAIVAVDPSSTRSGGAFLGDRIRMLEHVGDSGVYMRSVGSRGDRGGLSITTGEIVDLLARLPFDEVLVESVGIGQIEPDIRLVVDTTVVVVTPATGDDIQVQKAGTNEGADIFAVNKSDHDGAIELRRSLKQYIALGRPTGWIPQVVSTVGHDPSSVEALWSAVDEHRAYLRDGELEAGRAAGDLGERVARIVGSTAASWALECLAEDKELARRLADDEPPSAIARELLEPLIAAHPALRAYDRHEPHHPGEPHTAVREPQTVARGKEAR